MRADEPACADADQLLGKDLLSQAEKEYLAILDKQPGSVCAANGLQQVELRRCDAAKRLEEAGETDEAKKLYIEIVKTSPQLACATEGLGQTSNPKTPWIWWRIASTFLMSKLAAPAAFVFSLLLVVFLLPRLFRYWVKLKLDTATFSQGAVETPKNLSDGLVANVEQVIMHMSLENPGRQGNPDIIDKPLDIPAVPEFSSMPKDVSSLLNFFLKLFPPNMTTLSGVLQYDEQKGAGIAAKIVHSSGNKVLDAYTFWQRDYDPTFAPSTQATARQYFELSEIVAVWAYWQTYKYQRQGFRGEPVISPSRWIRLLTSFNGARWAAKLLGRFGTSEWRSYAHARVGARLFLSNLLKEAEASFRNALACDGRNRWALFQLAVLEEQRVAGAEHKEKVKAAKAYEPAIEHFRRALELSRDDQTRKPPIGDPVYVFSEYHLGAIDLYKYILGDRDSELLRQATELLKSAKEHVDDAVPNLMAPEVADLITLAYADALMMADNPKANELVKEIEGKHSFAPRLLYNLACHYSTAVDINKSRDSKADLDKAIVYLEGALAVEPGYVHWSKNDPSLRALRSQRKSQFALVMGSRATPKAANQAQGTNDALSAEWA